MMSIIPKHIPHIPLAKVRFVPVYSKYRAVWQRARVKIKSKLLLKYVVEDRLLFGAHVLSYFEASSQSAALTQVIRDKQEAAKRPSPIPVSRCLIYPDTWLNWLWTCLCSFLVLQTVFTLPIRLAFYDHTDALTWVYWDSAIDLVFFLDILMNLNTAFVDENNALVTSRWRIFLRYLKSWLIFDVLSCFPLYQFEASMLNGEKAEANSSDVLRLLRVSRIYRLLQISRLFKLFHQLRNQNFSYELHSLFSLTTRTSKVLIYILIMAMVMHLVACGWFLVARVQGFPAESWVWTDGVKDMQPADQYVAALYWTVVTLSTVGYGDIVPGTSMERIYASCWMLFTILFVSFTVSSLSSTLNTLHSKSNILTTKLAAIDEFTTQAGISKDHTRKLRNAVRLYQTSTQPLKHSVFKQLPKTLKYEVAMEMHNGAAKSLSFFAEKDKAFIVAIVPLLSHAFRKEMEYVYREKDHADEVYFIVSGGCYVMVTPQNAIRKLPHNTYFGEYEALHQVPRRFSLLTHFATNFLVLSQSLLHKIQLDFPDIYRELEEVASIRNALDEKAKRMVMRLLYLAKKGGKAKSVSSSRRSSLGSSVENTPAQQHVRRGSVRLVMPVEGGRFDPVESFEKLKVTIGRVDRQAKEIKRNLEKVLQGWS